MENSRLLIILNAALNLLITGEEEYVCDAVNETAAKVMSITSDEVEMAVSWLQSKKPSETFMKKFYDHPTFIDDNVGWWGWRPFKNGVKKQKIKYTKALIKSVQNRKTKAIQ